MSSDFSSFDKDKKIFDGWRRFLNEEIEAVPVEKGSTAEAQRTIDTAVAAAPAAPFSALPTTPPPVEPRPQAGLARPPVEPQPSSIASDVVARRKKRKPMDTTHSLQRGRPGWKETSHINIQGQKLPMSTMGFAAGTTPFADEKSMNDAGMLDPATDQLTDKGVRFYKQWRKNQIREKTILKYIERPK